VPSVAARFRETVRNGADASRRKPRKTYQYASFFEAWVSFCAKSHRAARAQVTSPGSEDPPGNGTFTAPSPTLHGAASQLPDTPGMESAGRLLFVATVTCYLLGRIFGGGAAPVEVVVYGMTAAFGLEYLLVSWGGLWQRG
jgi:hypothetical protein